MITGYLGNLDFAEEFFKRCQERKAVTEKSRILILEELHKELKNIRMTQEDIDRFKKGKKVVYLKKNTSNEN